MNIYPRYREFVLSNLQFSDFFTVTEKPFALKLFMALVKHTGNAKNPSVLTLDSLDDIIHRSNINHLTKHHNKLKSFIKDIQIRQQFCLEKDISELSLADELDDIVNVIECFYDVKFFTETNAKKNMILISEKDYGNNIRIGIMVKSSSYSNGFTVTVRGVNGSFVDSIEGDDRVAELLSESKLISYTKTYLKLPKTKDDLINDFLAIKILEKMPIVGMLLTDTKQVSIYPTYEGVGDISMYKLTGELK